jgi:aspartate carbamoyltransferase catalytic subunit
MGMIWKSKDLLSIEELSKNEIETILETAVSFKSVSERTVKKVPTLRGKTVVLFFQEPSTRTRTSFELASKRLSADNLTIQSSASSLTKGETLLDTMKTLESMKIDALVIRHSCSGIPHLLAQSMQASVINAGDGFHEHPTQALLDLLTVRENHPHLDQLTITFVGDILHSRVVRSNIYAFKKMGARIRVCGPPTLLPKDFEKWGVEVFYHLDAALQGTDVIYVLRLQLERQKKNLFPTLREYSQLYGITSDRLLKANSGAIVLHPGPMNRGIEISSGVADGSAARIDDQVSNGVAIRMAVLYLLLGENPERRTP